ncbi:hypothetical protein [Kamptonema formosum]|nr:hypothetical protein [Oscillatoria sp. PCC 10802]
MCETRSTGGFWRFEGGRWVMECRLLRGCSLCGAGRGCRWL